LQISSNKMCTDLFSPRPPSYNLPMFMHASGPLVSRELFRPVPHKSPLPVGLEALLLPTTGERQSVQGQSARAVHVSCDANTIAVRVDRLRLRAWATPSLFRLGSCEASSVGPLFLYFNHRLMECGGKSKLVYTHVLHYTPPPQGYIIRVLPLNLPIHCHYNRFHYSYQVGFKPQVFTNFALNICVYPAQGQPVLPDHWFYLGEPIYFVAQAGVLLAGERLYVDSCYATSSKDPNSKPKVDIIANYGYVSCKNTNGLQQSVYPFTFLDSCLLFVRRDMPALLLHVFRWEELEDTPLVCSCCDSTCTDVQDCKL
uniref:ZP domain-containing protein n=1 Tax=Cyclopterus lumpus TaxID=8103 RepID=A0A8C2ZHX5_CYCLU